MHCTILFIVKFTYKFACYFLFRIICLPAGSNDQNSSIVVLCEHLNYIHILSLNMLSDVKDSFPHQLINDCIFFHWLKMKLLVKVFCNNIAHIV